ncbi:hypothetical protein TNCV_1436451 [Trichonephila clavipes]|nr:hypothetical protein TNCV_1436451 [Trichonephila clavipes]
MSVVESRSRFLVLLKTRFERLMRVLNLLWLKALMLVGLGRLESGKLARMSTSSLERSSKLRGNVTNRFRVALEQRYSAHRAFLSGPVMV